MRVDIPDADRELLRKWLVSDEMPVNEVLDALAVAEPNLRVSRLADQVDQQIEDLPKDDLLELLHAFMSLSSTAAKIRDRNDEADVSGTLLRSITDQAVVAADEGVRFTERLDRLLSLESIEITAKAFSITSSQKSLCTARTLSEIRPVFREGSPVEASAAVLLHELELVFHEGPRGTRSQVFIALDESDLKHLKNVIERALDKHGKLIEIANKSGLKLL